MTNSVLQFIAAKRSELQKEADELRERIAQIDDELAALRRAELGAKNAIPELAREMKRERNTTNRIKPHTIMYEVMEILQNSPSGLIALDILRELNTEREPPLMRTSLSPQLSRLKQGGFIKLDGSTWSVTGREWRPQNELFPDNRAHVARDELGNAPKNAETADVAPGKDASAASINPETQGRKAGPGGGA